MTVLAGVLAITLDGGGLLAERRHAQSTADAAALAAAADLYANYKTNSGADTGGTAKASALSVANANGYSNDGTHSTVTVHIPPTAGDHVGVAGYAEVIVQYSQPRFFSALWGAATVPVSARAVARGQWANGTATGGNADFLLLASSGTAIAGKGGGNSGGLFLNSGHFVANSTGPNVFNFSGHPMVTAAEFDFASTQANLGLGNNPGQYLSGLNNSSPNIKYSQSPTPDPLSGLPVPPLAGLPAQSFTGQSVINPGIYNGGISTNSDVTMNPGIYYLQNGGLTIGGHATVDGSSGVLLYVSPGAGNSAVSTGGTSTLILNPLATGTYKGISIFVDRTATNATMELGGTPTGNIYGTVYAPTANLTLHGTAGENSGSQVIINTVTLKGNASAGAGLGPEVGQTNTFQLVE
jgi:hypothetical protein